MNERSKVFIVAGIFIVPGEKWALEPMIIMAKNQQMAEDLAFMAAGKQGAEICKTEDFGFECKVREVSWESMEEMYKSRPLIITT